MPTKEQLQILIKAKIITEGQAKDLQQLAAQIQQLEKQQKSLNRSNAIRESKLKKIQAAEAAALAETKKRIGGAIHAEETLRRVEEKYTAQKQKQLAVIRANNMMLKENKTALIAARKEMTFSQIGLEGAARKADVFNQYLAAGGKNAVAFGSSMRKAVKEGKLQHTFQGITSAIKDTTQNMSIFGKKGHETFSSISRTVRRIVTTMLTLGSIVLFRNLIRQGAEFEAALIRVGATAKATQEQFQELVETVRQVARETIFTASQVSQVAQILAQAGFKVGEIFASLNPILKLAGATMGELGQTTELVVSILRAFNLRATETADVANILTEATLSSRANIERLSVAFRFGGPAAASFNQNLQTAVATLSRFIDLGLSASIAGTTLRRALIELSQGSTRQIKVLKQLNISLDQINPNLNDFGKILETLSTTAISSSQAIQLFGARAGASVFALIDRIRQGGESITEFAQKLGDAKELNRVTTLFTKITESIKAQSMLARSALEELGISLFNVFRPTIAKLLVTVRERFLELNEELKKESGKDFAQTLQDIVPLITAMLNGIVSAVKLFGRLVYVIAELTSRFSFFAKIVQVVTFAIGAMVIKSLLFNNVVIGLLGVVKGLTIAIGSRLVLAMIGFSRITETVVAALFKVEAAAISAGLSLKFLLTATGIGALLLLVALLPKIVGWLSKKKSTTDEAAAAQAEYNQQLEITGQDLKRLSEATLIQIDSQQRLNELNAQGKVALFNQRSEMVEALKIPVPDTFQVLPTYSRNAMGKTVSTIKQGMDEFARIAELRSEMVSKDMGKSLELPEKVQADIISSYRSTVRDVSRQTAKAAGVINKALQDNLVASKIANPKQAIFFVQNFVEGIRKEANKQGKSVADAMKPITKAIDKDEKTGKFKFTMDTVGAREGFKKFLKELRIDVKTLNEDAEKALQNAFANTVKASEEAAISLESLGEKSARAVERQFQERFKQLAEQRIATEKLAKGVSDILREGGTNAQNEVIKSQTVINKALKDTNDRIKIIAEERKTIRARMADESDEQKHLSQITLNQLEIDLEREQALKRIVGNLVRITVSIEESNALTALGDANIALQEKRQAQINEKLGERQALLEAERNRFLDIGDSLEDILGSFEGIDDILKSDEVAKAFRDEEVALNEINRELDIASTYERNIKDLEEDLARIRLGGQRSLQASTTEQDIQRDINQQLMTDSERTQAVTALTAELEAKKTESRKQAAKIIGIEAKITDRINATTKSILEKGRDIVAEQLKIKRSPLAAAGKEIIDQFKQTNHLLDIQEGKLKAQRIAALKALHIGKDTNADIIKANQGLKNINIARQKALELAELQFKKRKEIENVRTVEMMADAVQLAGAANLASVLKDEFDRREKMRVLREQDLNTLTAINSMQKRIGAKEEARIKKVAKASAFEKKGDKEKVKQLNAEIANDDRSISLLKERLEFTKKIREERQKSFDILKKEIEGGFYDRVAQSLKLQAQGWILSQDAAKTYMNTLKDLGGIMKSFAGAALERMAAKSAGLMTEEAEKTADELKKIQDDLNKQLLQNELDYLNKVMDAHIEHRKRMADINSEYDREIREVERDIFNERVERMMELARIEQELRSSGLTTEQQRANLLSTIDQNLASIRIGTIEQRQAKLAELETQIKSLNELEQNLGISQSEIDQGSLARLDNLKRETAAFFNDKQRLQVASLEAERERELEAERLRFQQQLLQLEREREIADQRANQAAEDARARIDITKAENDEVKQLYADLTLFAVTSAAEQAAAFAGAAIKKKFFSNLAAETEKKNVQEQILDQLKLIASRKTVDAVEQDSTIKKVAATKVKMAAETQEAAARAAGAKVAQISESRKQTSDMQTAVVSKASSASQQMDSLKNATGDANEAAVAGGKDAIKKLGMAGLLVAPLIIAGIFALLAPLISRIGRFKGGRVDEQGRASGGIIKGGHGGIDDIHTALPQGSYIVNRQSTRAHQKELAMMTSSIRDAVSSRNRLPVAVTAGEFYVPPGVYRKHADRIDQINRDRSGVTAMETAYHGGRIGLQMGGAVEGNNEPSRSVTVNNLFEFSGTNIFGGDEESVRDLYENSLRNLIQQDIDNNALL